MRRPGGVGVAATAGGDHDVLAAIDHIGGGCGDSGIRHLGFPKDLAAAGVEGGELAVTNGGSDEDPPPAVTMGLVTKKLLSYRNDSKKRG